MRFAWVRRAIVVALATLGAACSLIVDFTTKPAPDCDGGDCADATEIDPCASLPDGAVCDFLSCQSCKVCDNGSCTRTRMCPEGYAFDKASPTSRCCNGLPVSVTTNANCGVCGVKCNTTATPAQDCQPIDGHYFCTNCRNNSDCWSNCCSNTMGYHCAASDCNNGSCPPGICPVPSKCVLAAANEPNYCSYD